MATINKKKQKVNSILEILRANGVSEDQIEAISPRLEETVEDSVAPKDLEDLQNALLAEIQKTTEATNQRLTAVENKEESLKAIESSIDTKVKALDQKVATQAVEFKRVNDRADEEAKKNLAARQELKKQLDERNAADDKVAELAQVVSSLSKKQTETSKALDSINKEISAEDGQIANLAQKIGNLESKSDAQEQAIKDQGKAHVKALSDTLSAIDERFKSPNAALAGIKTQLEGLPQGIATQVEKQISEIIETKISEVLKQKLGGYVESLTKIESDLMVAGRGFKKLLEKLEGSADAAVEKMEKGSEEISKKVKSVSDEAGKTRDKLVETRTSFDSAYEDLSNLVSSLIMDVQSLQKEKREVINIGQRSAQSTHSLVSGKVNEMVVDFMNKYEVLNNRISDSYRQRISESTTRENQVYKDVRTFMGSGQEVFEKISTLVAGIDVERIEGLKADILSLKNSQGVTGSEYSEIKSELAVIKQQMEIVDAISKHFLEKNEKEIKGGN